MDGHTMKMSLYAVKCGRKRKRIVQLVIASSVMRVVFFKHKRVLLKFIPRKLSKTVMTSYVMATRSRLKINRVTKMVTIAYNFDFFPFFLFCYTFNDLLRVYF